MMKNRKMNSFKDLTASKGAFTLLELIVAIGVFSVTITIAAGGLARVLRLERQVSTLLSVNASASAVIEEMAREVRTGYDYVFPGTLPLPPVPCDAPHLFCFTNAVGNRIAYSLVAQSAGAPFTNLTTHVILREVYATGNPNPIESSVITPDNADVLSVTFVPVKDNGPSGGDPERVTMTMSIAPVDPSLEAQASHFETSVSSRAE